MRRRDAMQFWVAQPSHVLAMASSPSRTFCSALEYYSIAEKFVSAGRRNQHARRMRYPIQSEIAR
jgi:1,2-phenylacetyl-CoA epoxidase PaaB subunit